MAKVNETASPTTIPSGRRRPPVAPAESAIGSTGSTHGESAVPAPAKKPKSINRTIASTFPPLYYEEMMATGSAGS